MCCISKQLAKEVVVATDITQYSSLSLSSASSSTAESIQTFSHSWRVWFCHTLQQLHSAEDITLSGVSVELDIYSRSCSSSVLGEGLISTRQASMPSILVPDISPTTRAIARHIRAHAQCCRRAQCRPLMDLNRVI